MKRLPLVLDMYTPVISNAVYTSPPTRLVRQGIPDAALEVVLLTRYTMPTRSQILTRIQEKAERVQQELLPIVHSGEPVLATKLEGLLLLECTPFLNELKGRDQSHFPLIESCLPTALTNGAPEAVYVKSGYLTLEKLKQRTTSAEREWYTRNLHERWIMTIPIEGGKLVSLPFFEEDPLRKKVIKVTSLREGVPSAELVHFVCTLYKKPPTMEQVQDIPNVTEQVCEQIAFETLERALPYIASYRSLLSRTSSSLGRTTHVEA